MSVHYLCLPIHRENPGCCHRNKRVCSTQNTCLLSKVENKDMLSSQLGKAETEEIGSMDSGNHGFYSNKSFPNTQRRCCQFKEHEGIRNTIFCHLLYVPCCSNQSALLKNDSTELNRKTGLHIHSSFFLSFLRPFYYLFRVSALTMYLSLATNSSKCPCLSLLSWRESSYLALK